GRLATPSRAEAEAEVERTRAFFPKSFSFPLEFVYGNEGTTVGPGSVHALSSFLKALGAKGTLVSAPGNQLADNRKGFDAQERQHRQVQELVNHTQRLLQLSERVRDEFLWRKVKPTSTNDWVAATQEFKTNLWDEVIGRFPKASEPINPRARKILDNPKWTGYEVT